VTLLAAPAAPRILRPTSLEEAANQLAQHAGARIVAGGTALQLEWRYKPQAAYLVDITALTRLTGIAAAADGIVRIGAVTRLEAIAQNPLIAERAPLVAETVRRIAAPGVRRLATLGGNIAGSGCLVPTLLALGASVEIADSAGPVALRAWLRAPRGIVVAVLVPPPGAHHHGTHSKIGLRAAFTPSVIGAAGVIEADPAGRIAAARFAVGGGTTPPQCLDGAGASLIGQAFAAIDWRALRDRLAAEIAAPDDPVRSSRYRKRAAANVLVTGLGGPRAVDAVCAPIASRPGPAPRLARPPALVEVPRARRSLAHSS
jgi:nicotinate dehydrogenase large molybdopterin subunit